MVANKITGQLNGAAVSIFFRQLHAVVKKNLITLIARRWLSTFIQALLIPIVLLAVFLNIDNFTNPGNGYGIGTPARIKTVAENLAADPGQLVIVSNSSPDVETAIQKLVEPLAHLPDKVVRLENLDDVYARCRPNFLGISSCYAAVTFHDSPLTPRDKVVPVSEWQPVTANASWQYTITTDPSRTTDGFSQVNAKFDVKSHDSANERIRFPLQLAIHSAIQNVSFTADIFDYTLATQDEFNLSRMMSWQSQARGIVAMAFLLSLIIPVYHAVNFVSTERSQGVSRLVDVMGGGAAVRVYSNVFTFNILYLPLSIVSGILYRVYLLPTAGAAPVIFWCILTTMAVVNAAIFAAAFFSSPRISSVFVAAATLAIAGGALITENKIDTQDWSVLLLAFLFPSANYMFFIGLMCRQGERLDPVDFSATFTGIWPKAPSTVGVGLWMYFIFLVLQVLLYPALAIVMERLVHGISYTRRDFANGDEAQASIHSILTTGLKKVYQPSLGRRIFCGRRAKAVNALDGLDLVANKGQVMCLLGVNGSGKTTTLDIIGGSHSSTEGSVKINCDSTKLGVCPQKNVLFPYLTVLEHVKFWSHLKHGSEPTEELERLVEYCDLKPKINFRARDLSGGQKRKLQLACMLAGGSEVCLIDECTSGLDPISRRAIWNIILGERSRRSIVFTTHFLDEGEVLADQIVLLSKGKIKAQGTPAELKNTYGPGYVVHIPLLDDEKQIPEVGVPYVVHQDRVRFQVPNTKAAAALMGRLEAMGIAGATMAGPTIEDVFLKLTTDVDETLRRELGEGPEPATDASAAAGDKLASGRPLSSWKQILVLMRKRFTILPRYWIAPLLALGLGAGLPSTLRPLLIDEMMMPPMRYERPLCGNSTLEALDSINSRFRLTPRQVAFQIPYSYGGIETETIFPLGPPSWNQSLLEAVSSRPVVSPWFNASSISAGETLRFVDSADSLQAMIRDSVGGHDLATVARSFYNGISSYGFGGAQEGGFFITENTTDSTSVLIANRIGGYTSNTMGIVVLFTAARSTVNVTTYTNEFMSARWALAAASSGSESLMYVLLASLILTVYPVFFALYPAFEKSHGIRGLQYANGVRPFPLWMSHLLTDMTVVLVVSLALTATLMGQLGSTIFFHPGFMFFVSMLYGLAAILIGYIISARVARTQLAAFMLTLMILAVSLIAAVLAMVLPLVYSDPAELINIREGVFWGLGLVLPIVNVLKGFMIGLNTTRIACRNDEAIIYPGHIYAYGGPILLLLVQIVFLMLLLVWLESNNSFAALKAFVRNARGKRSGPAVMRDEECINGQDDMVKETARVDASSDDLLRLSHVSKSYGSNLAVDDVSFGLQEGEIMALLGPNGAGKSTAVNMIMGELTPDAGSIQVRGVDVHLDTRLAQRSLGVCQQTDSLDLMTAREHLEFYARVKGVEDVARNVAVVLAKTGLGPHADRRASKLSGGNKRKLSLGIALVGNPDVLVLDEPSSAMDAASKRVLWKTLAEIGPGRSLLLTTHSLEEADALATRAAILSKGLLAIGTTQQLRSRYSDFYHVQLVLRSAPATDRAELGRVEGWVRERFPAAEVVGESLGGQVQFKVPNVAAGGAGSTIAQMIAVLEENKEELGLTTYGVAQPTLENVFISVVKDNYAEEDGRKRRWWQFWQR